MDLKELEYFKMVCEQKSINDAPGAEPDHKEYRKRDGGNLAEQDGFRYQPDQIRRVSL